MENQKLTICLLVAGILLLLLIVARLSRKSRKSERELKYLRWKTQEEKNREREVGRRRAVSKAMRLQVLERDNYTCQICGISKGFLDDLCPGLGEYLLLEIDHVRSVAQGGTGKDIDNLQVLCWRCNKKKGKSKTNRQVRKAITYGIQYLPKSRWF